MDAEIEGRDEEHVDVSDLDKEIFRVGEEVEGRDPQDEVGHAHLGVDDT